MAAGDAQFLPVEGAGGVTRRIAYISSSSRSAKTPGLVWLNGLNSVMTGTKAGALADWACGQDIPMLRFDYSGHGQSDGAFADGTVGRWLEDTCAILKKRARGPRILAGSSMGGWLALLVLRAIAVGDPAARGLPPIAGAVLVAPAWDMTEELMWKQFPADVRRTIETEGVYHRPSRYGDGHYPISRMLIEEGRNHLIAATQFDPGCPVRILQGRRDPDVPWRHAGKLARLLTGSDVEIFFIADGDHRLSRPDDIATLIRIVERLCEAHWAAGV